ncbi:MAG: hypothetical protein KKF27_20755 [Gammaproteobacteria bacterium]|nr:hypothetical protein [Gammaproteobacteria bacterium]
MNLQQINAKLAELEAVRRALVGEARKTDGIEALEAAQPKYALGSPEHEALLQTGYGMTADEARKIIKERDADPVRWPLEEYRKARAMLEALAVKSPKPSSTRQPWRIRHRSRSMRT